MDFYKVQLSMPDKHKFIQKGTEAVFDFSSEMERLKKDIYRSDIEKLKLFTQMLRTNNLLKKTKITHKYPQ
ncbi:hypothetical protein DVR12_13455 [Chitinophaga silvatica]|uniref:Uncharacterized protein n=1 Tax=Chitinophaga silvatica TaxID=2282649 RepID=A0A3E1YAP7_9BACT|nr:hypothetical protein DVR12_13455 [Chitinophaga silvatica]